MYPSSEIVMLAVTRVIALPPGGHTSSSHESLRMSRLRHDFDPALLAEPVVEHLARLRVGRVDPMQRRIGGGDEHHVSFAGNVADPFHACLRGKREHHRQDYTPED